MRSKNERQALKIAANAQYQGNFKPTIIKKLFNSNTHIYYEIDRPSRINKRSKYTENELNELKEYFTEEKVCLMTLKQLRTKAEIILK